MPPSRVRGSGCMSASAAAHAVRAEEACVALDVRGGIERDPLAGLVDEVEDPLGAVAGVPLRADEDGPLVVDGGVVGGDDPAARSGRAARAGRRTGSARSTRRCRRRHGPGGRRGRRGRSGPGRSPAAGSRCGRRRRHRRSSATARRTSRGPPGSRRSRRRVFRPEDGLERPVRRGARMVAVQRRAISGASARRSSTSLRIGPWTVSRTSSVDRSAPPVTVIVSWRTVNGRDVPSGPQVAGRVGRVDASR